MTYMEFEGVFFYEILESVDLSILLNSKLCITLFCTETNDMKRFKFAALCSILYGFLLFSFIIIIFIHNFSKFFYHFEYNLREHSAF